jgi:hypothetical protein
VVIWNRLLLLRRPPAPLALPGDHLDTTIRIAFLPGIKQGKAWIAGALNSAF